MACGRDLVRGQIFLLFLSLADHMPECNLVDIEYYSSFYLS